MAFGAELQWTQRGAARELRAPGPFHAARACPRHQLHAGRTPRVLRKGRPRSLAATGATGGTAISIGPQNGYLVGVTFHRFFMDPIWPNKVKHPEWLTIKKRWLGFQPSNWGFLGHWVYHISRLRWILVVETMPNPLPLFKALEITTESRVLKPRKAPSSSSVVVNLEILPVKWLLNHQDRELSGWTARLDYKRATRSMLILCQWLPVAC